MKKILLIFFIFFAVFSYGQNISVNTTGAAAASTNMLEVLQPSATTGTVGMYSLHSGGAGGVGTGYGLWAEKTGVMATNIAAYLSATGGTNNYALIVPSGGGNVGIGTTAPSQKLEVSGGNIKLDHDRAIVWRNSTNTADVEYIAVTGVGSPMNNSINFTVPGLPADPSNARFVIAGDGRFFFRNNTPSNVVIIESNGNVGIGIAAPTSVLHTVASGAKTAAYIGNLLTNTATSSTASIAKTGADIQSTGTWNGANAVNTGLTVTASGGTINYGAQFTGYNTPVIFGSNFGTLIQMGVISNTAAAANILAQFSLNSRYEGTGNTYRTPNPNVYPKVIEMQNDYIRFMGLNTFVGTDAAYTPTEWMRITSDGRVGIGRTPTTNILEINGAGSQTTAGDWLANSDRRIKTNICDIDNAIGIIMKLHPVKFKYTEEWKRRNSFIADHDHYYYNYIAQEYMQIFPESVQGSGEYLESDTTHNNEILQMNAYNAQIVAIKAIQEQQQLIDSLQSTIYNLQLENQKQQTINKKQQTELSDIKSNYENRLRKIEYLLGAKTEK